MRIKKIVITGGPCAGKTQALKYIKEYFTPKGVTVLSVPEAATELISGGIAPWTCTSKKEYQKYQLILQLQLEQIFMDAAKAMNQEEVLIVCDRGILDAKAYITQDEFDEFLAEVGITEEEALCRYDAVFHLETAAKGQEEAYTLSNNHARTETVEEAVLVDDRTQDAWKNHPEWYMIGNEECFRDKMEKLMMCWNQNWNG